MRCSATAMSDSVGGTRRGKSGLYQIIARNLAARREGFTLLDPHGECARAVRDWMANPVNGCSDIKVHFFDPASSDVIGLNCLTPYDDSFEAAHDAAQTLTSVIESRFEASPEQTPRLSRLIYVAAFICAKHKLTLLEVLEVLSLGGGELRRALLHDFDNQIVRSELEDLHTLATRSPREFLALVESVRNRLVRWLADPRLARCLGQRRGLDLTTVMDESHVLLFDGSGLAYADAALLSCFITSMGVAAARQRPPLQSPTHRLTIHEAESMLTVDCARGVDQTAKYGLTYTFAISETWHNFAPAAISSPMR